MALPAVGDGEYVGHTNTNETVYLGYGAQGVQVGGAAAAVVLGTTTGTVKIGSSTGYVGFYGKTPVVRRTFSSAVHVTSNLATSASFGATQLAAIQEIQNTLIGLGIWATA